jgi:hypothetical protein
MAAEDAELYVSGDSGFSGSLSGAVPLALAVQGNSGQTASLKGSLPLGLVTSGNSAFFAAPQDFDISMMSLGGRSEFTMVALLRRAFVPGPIPGIAPASQFPGLQVGRIPSRKILSPTLNTNPSRRKPPEAPER